MKPDLATKSCPSCGTTIMLDARGCAWCGHAPPRTSTFDSDPREPRPGVVRRRDVRTGLYLAYPAGMFVAGAASHDCVAHGLVAAAWTWFAFALVSWACWAAKVLKRTRWA